MDALYFSIIGLHVAPIATILWMLLTRHRWFSVVAATFVSGFLGVSIAFTHFGPQSWLAIASNAIVSALASGATVWLIGIIARLWEWLRPSVRS